MMNPQPFSNQIPNQTANPRGTNMMPNANQPSPQMMLGGRLTPSMTNNHSMIVATTQYDKCNKYTILHRVLTSLHLFVHHLPTLQCHCNVNKCTHKNNKYPINNRHKTLLLDRHPKPATYVTNAGG